MRTITIVMVMLIAAGPVAFADAGVDTGTRRIIKDFTLESADPDYITGKVVCVVPAELMRPKAELIVADDSGAETCFTVKVLAVIYNTAGKMLSLDQLAPGTPVQVNYRPLSCDVKEATSVKVLR